MYLILVNMLVSVTKMDFVLSTFLPNYLQITSIYHNGNNHIFYQIINRQNTNLAATLISISETIIVTERR